MEPGLKIVGARAAVIYALNHCRRGRGRCFRGCCRRGCRPQTFAALLLLDKLENGIPTHETGGISC